MSVGQPRRWRARGVITLAGVVGLVLAGAEGALCWREARFSEGVAAPSENRRPMPAHSQLATEVRGAADLTVAMREVLARRDPTVGAEELERLLADWCVRRPAATADWLLAEPLTKRAQWFQLVVAALADQPAVLNALVTQLVARDPAQASAYVGPTVAAFDDAGNFAAASAALLLLPVGAERDALLGEHAEKWSAAEPRAAAEFAATLPDGLGRTHALTLSVQAWLKQDVTAASEWLARLSPEAALDTPIFALATDPVVDATAPSVAAQWAERIGNPDVRLQGIRAAVASWAERDRAAARQFLRTTPALNEDFRRTLLAEIDGG